MNRSFGSKFLAIVLAVALVGCQANAVNQVLSDIDLALQTGNVICSSIAIENQGDATACASIATIGINSLTVVQTAYNGYEASGSQTDLAKLQAALAAVKTNLSAALKAAHIVDPNTVTLVTNWVNLIIGVVNDVVTLIPQLQTNQVAAKDKVAKQASSVAAYLPTAEGIKAQWDAKVCNGVASCENLVTVHHIHKK
jgi:hypothetical protein